MLFYLSFSKKPKTSQCQYANIILVIYNKTIGYVGFK